MGKTILLAVAAFFILTLGGGYLWLKLNNQTLSPINNSTPSVSDKNIGTSFDTLISSNTPIRCTFDNGGDKGVAYFSSGKARLDFDATLYNPDAEGNNKYSDNKYHLIAKDEILYVWRNEEKNGILSLKRLLKTNSPTTETSIVEEEQVADYGGFLSDVDYNYLCESWQEDSLVFDPPTDIDFVRSITPETTPLPVPTDNIVVPQ